MSTGTVLTVRPSLPSYELLLTATMAITHHDAAIQDDSNRLLFNRQEQLLAVPSPAAAIAQHVVDALCDAHPVPIDLAELFNDISFPEFLGTVLVRTFLDMYNSLAGAGLFAGMERYARLESRLRQAAICSAGLAPMWDRLCDGLRVPIHDGEHDAMLLNLLKIPPVLQQMVLRVLSDDYRSVVALARLWHATAKLASAEYAAAVGKPQITRFVRVGWPADSLAVSARDIRVVEVPAISGNSLRHQLVREPAWWHLAGALSLTPAEPGQGPIPTGVEAIFYNGGNIAAGAKQPSNTYTLARKARAAYPSLDLLGGVTDSFDLGESKLRIGAWLVCAENRPALAGSPAYDLPAASVSVFDMLDDVTLTRQAGETGVGQMIFTFETLCAGSQVLVRMGLAPYTRRLTHGALVAAVETYLADDATIGGQAARGFGHVQGQWLSRPEDADMRAEYEAYIAANQEMLRQGLVDGTLCTGTRILS